MFEIISFPFFQRALLAGIILSISMAMLGVFVVLRKMSFFSDAIGHSALTGIALGLLIDINPFLAAFIFSLVVAFGIGVARTRSRLAFDTLLGIFFSASVALGVILVNLSSGYQTDLVSYLFGNILTVSTADVISSFLMALIIGITLLFIGKKLVFIAFDQTLARAEGITIDRYEIIFLLLLAGMIALSIKLVGVILVTAMLVIPAATGQNIARSLASMFAISALTGLISVVVGMFASAALRTPSGPVIILAATSLFVVTFIIKHIYEKTTAA